MSMIILCMNCYYSIIVFLITPYDYWESVCNPWKPTSRIPWVLACMFLNKMIISWISYMSTSFHATILYNFFHAMIQDTYILNTSYFMKPCLQVISWNHDYKLFTSYVTKDTGFLANYIMFMFLGVARITEKAQIAWNNVATVGQGSLRPDRTIP